MAHQTADLFIYVVVDDHCILDKWSIKNSLLVISKHMDDVDVVNDFLAESEHFKEV